MAKVKIRFVGHHGRRILDDYEWNPENNHICPVDIQTAANLLTYPRPDFHLVKDQQMSDATAKQLADALGVAKSDIDKVIVESEPVVPSPKLTDIPGIGEARAEELAEKGVKEVADLAALDKDGIEKLARNTGASRGQLQEWVKAAQEIIGG